VDVNDEGEANGIDEASEVLTSMSSAPQREGPLRFRFESVLVGLLCALIGGFYVWTVRSSGDAWNFGEEQRDYYNLLIDGYLDGQLHMKVPVPEALLKLENPYDPGQRPPGLGLHDASFYKGKYYVYFGAAPMVVLMLPFRIVTGVDLPLAVAGLIFIYGGFLVTVTLLLAIRRRYFAETSTLAVLLGVLVLGLAGTGPVLLRRPHMWELPIGGGYFFAMVALGCVWRSLHSERRRVGWFSAAALALGLAIASRPTYLIAGPFLGVPLLWWWRETARNRGAARRLPVFPWREMVAALVPLAIVGMAMAWHNYARFENPLQFGQAYQFSLDYESKLPHFAARYVPFTAKAHFFAPAEWSRYFPFISRGDLGATPEGYTIHRGDVYGILTHFPIAWLALLAPLALWRRTADERGRLGTWLATAVLLFALAAAVLFSFFGTLARYQMDFVPTLMLLACVGLLAGERWARRSVSEGVRRVLRGGVAVVAVGSAMFGILFSLQFDGLLPERNPRLNAKVARLLNRVPAAIERMAGVRYGPLELSLRLPEARRSGTEVLLSAGEAPRVERVFVRHGDDGRVQFGAVTAGAPERVTRWMALDPKTVHRVRASAGWLYPPVTHPFFAGMTAGEVRDVTRELRIDVNGEPVLREHQRGSGVGGARIRVGSAAIADATSSVFRGEIVRVQRGASAVRREQGVFVRLRLSIGQTDAPMEPLVAFGENGARGLLVIKRHVSGEWTLGWVDSGQVRMSDPIAIAPGRVAELVVRSEAGENGATRWLVWLDSVIAWSFEESGGRGAVEPIVAGRAPRTIADCAAEFGGKIFQTQIAANGIDPLAGSGSKLRMRVQFPTPRAGQRDPLLVTGRHGAGEMLMADYIDAQTMRFGLDHWGAPMRLSPPVRVDFSQAHEIEIDLLSLETVPDATLVRAEKFGRVQVKLDGAMVWSHETDLATVEPEEVAVGRNPIGGTSCGPRFTGDILFAERVAPE
jgi:hypothetical protein